MEISEDSRPFRDFDVCGVGVRIFWRGVAAKLWRPYGWKQYGFYAFGAWQIGFMIWPRIKQGVSK